MVNSDERPKSKVKFLSQQLVRLAGKVDETKALKNTNSTTFLCINLGFLILLNSVPHPDVQNKGKTEAMLLVLCSSETFLDPNAVDMRAVVLRTMLQGAYSFSPKNPCETSRNSPIFKTKQNKTVNFT